MDNDAILKSRALSLSTLGNGQAVRDLFRQASRTQRAIVAYALQEGVEKQILTGHTESFVSLYPDVKGDPLLKNCAFEGLARATTTLLQGPASAFARLATSMIAHQKETRVCAQWHQRIKPALDTRIHLANSNEDFAQLTSLNKHLGFLKD